MQFNTATDLRERGFRLEMPPVTIVAFDPAGDGDDYDAVVALSREEHQHGEVHDPDFAVEFLFRVLMAYRMPQNWEFPDKLAGLISLDRTLKSWTKARRQTTHVFCVESNGVGYGYASSLSQKTDTKVIPYTTVASASAVRTPVPGTKVSMPRLRALDNMRILMETKYLQIEKSAPGQDQLAAELSAFVWRQKGRPEAQLGQHDDLVMAACGATWIGSKVLPPLLKQIMVSKGPMREPASRMRIN